MKKLSVIIFTCILIITAAVFACNKGKESSENNEGINIGWHGCIEPIYLKIKTSRM